MRPIDYAKEACDMMMRKFMPQQLPPVGKFYYHQGVFLSGMENTFALTGEEKYFQYMKDWVDAVLGEDGIPLMPQPGELDDIMAGVLLFPLLERTGEARYEKGLEYLRSHLLKIPRTSEGAPWHKTKLPYQMWLDGLYMIGTFCGRYAQKAEDSVLYDLMVRHIQVMVKHTKDDNTGLYYHGWDESGEAEWCDPKTGCSPEFWGRSVGWAAYGLVNDLDYLKEDSSEYKEVYQYMKDTLTAVMKYQSEEGRWYQVLDKGDQKGNWLENSCSCLFVAAICKAIRKGYVDKSFMSAARCGYEAVIKSLTWEDTDLQIGHVCVGTNIGDYAHYCARPVHANDLHGVGTFLLMCTEMERLIRVEEAGLLK